MTLAEPQPHATETRMAASLLYPGTPRWVKASVTVVGVLVLLAVFLMLAGGGHHGPGRHMPSGDAGGHKSPEGGH